MIWYTLVCLIILGVLAYLFNSAGLNYGKVLLLVSGVLLLIGFLFYCLSIK